MRDWDLLERAADQKIEEQQEFVGWWDANVGRPGGDRQTINTVSALMLSLAEAEALTGFTQQQVSRIRSKLKNPEKYKEQIFGAAHLKALYAGW